MIKAVFFDVGGTLIEPTPSVGAIYSELAARHGIHAAPDDLQSAFKSFFAKRDPLKTATKEGWKDVVLAVFSSEKQESVLPLFEEIYEEFRKPDRWRVFPDVHVTLNRLKEKNLRLAVVSNWDDRLPGLLKQLGLSHYFSHFFISYALNLAKPDPAIFKHALLQMNVDGLEAIHVGDHENEDVAAAQAAGLRAYLINREKKPLNSRQIISLTELLDRV